MHLGDQIAPTLMQKPMPTCMLSSSTLFRCLAPGSPLLAAPWVLPQILFLATVPEFQRSRGLGSLLTCCVLRAAARAGLQVGKATYAGCVYASWQGNESVRSP